MMRFLKMDRRQRLHLRVLPRSAWQLRVPKQWHSGKVPVDYSPLEQWKGGIGNATVVVWLRLAASWCGKLRWYCSLDNMEDQKYLHIAHLKMVNSHSRSRCGTHQKQELQCCCSIQRQTRQDKMQKWPETSRINIKYAATEKQQKFRHCNKTWKFAPFGRSNSPILSKVATPEASDGDDTAEP